MFKKETLSNDYSDFIFVTSGYTGGNTKNRLVHFLKIGSLNTDKPVFSSEIRRDAANSTDGTVDSNFGKDMVGHGRYIAIASKEDDDTVNSLSHVGRVYIYRDTSSNNDWSSTSLITTLIGKAINDKFGEEMDINKDYIVIGGQAAISGFRKTHIYQINYDGTNTTITNTRTINGSSYKVALNYNNYLAIQHDYNIEIKSLDKTYAQVINNTDDFSFNKLNFTIEFWIYFTVKGEQEILKATNSSGTSVWKFTSSSDGKIGFITNDLTVLTPVSSYTKDNWIHVELSKYSSTYNLFINGVFKASGSSSASISNVSSFTIGSPSGFEGYIDGLRILKGISLHTETTTFTPTATAYNAPTAANSNVFTLNTINGDIFTSGRNELSLLKGDSNIKIKDYTAGSSIDYTVDNTLKGKFDTNGLEINGGIKLGDTVNTENCVIRYISTSNDFEGRMNDTWVTLTAGVPDSSGNITMNGNLNITGNNVNISNNTDLSVSTNPDPYTVAILPLDNNSTPDISGRGHSLTHNNSELDSSIKKYGINSLKIGNEQSYSAYINDPIALLNVNIYGEYITSGFSADSRNNSGNNTKPFSFLYNYNNVFTKGTLHQYSDVNQSGTGVNWGKHTGSGVPDLVRNNQNNFIVSSDDQTDGTVYNWRKGSSSTTDQYSFSGTKNFINKFNNKFIWGKTKPSSNSYDKDHILYLNVWDSTSSNSISNTSNNKNTGFNLVTEIPIQIDVTGTENVGNNVSTGISSSTLHEKIAPKRIASYKNYVVVSSIGKGDSSSVINRGSNYHGGRIRGHQIFVFKFDSSSYNGSSWSCLTTGASSGTIATGTGKFDVTSSWYTGSGAKNNATKTLEYFAEDFGNPAADFIPDKEGEEFQVKFGFCTDIFEGTGNKTFIIIGLNNAYNYGNPNNTTSERATGVKYKNVKIVEITSNNPNIEYRPGCETISSNGQANDEGQLFTFKIIFWP